MSILFSYYSGVFADALTAGAFIGALAGIVVFTAASAAEGIQRVLLGFVIGGIVMGVIQAVIISTTTGVGGDMSINPLLQSEAGQFGGVLYRGIVLTVQTALGAGLLMVISLAPFRALKGAIAGLIIGSVAAFLSWGALQFVDTAIPLVIFYILVLGVVLFIIDHLPARG